ncbi:MAG TPA: phosphatase domain-containing protein, partial [Flavobacteriaceae bacterium]|nr:phosphatase domain-containing protein [Flavobacteriaceae bacterium]
SNYLKTDSIQKKENAKKALTEAEKVKRYSANAYGKRKDPLTILTYGGYANEEGINATARVLEDEGIITSNEDNIFRNMLNSYRRFETDEIPNAKVQVTINNKTYDYLSNKEGYIEVNQNIEIPKNLSDQTKWMPIKYDLLANNNIIYSTQAQVMQPSQNAEYGIITDMDDTVIDTGLSSRFKYKVVINTFFKRSNDRIPLDGAVKFYNMLHKGYSQKYCNPFFYLSNSPWNLHSYLINFLDYHDFPKGTLLLRDIGFENEKKDSFLERNKFLKITHILETYPNLPFILIGDAADIDYDIYIEVARRYPDRVLAIYIRTVQDEKKMKVVEKIIESTTDVEVQLIENTDLAISHAKANGLIKP